MSFPPIDNTADVIDSRDVIARLRELERLAAREPEETDEMNALAALAEEASDYAADWEYGETLIRDSYFVDYARELADDICPSPEAREMSETWPYRCIDWGQAARELQMDYTSVDFDGVEYWIR